MQKHSAIAIILIGIGLTFASGSVADNHSGDSQAGNMDTEATRALIERFNEAWINNDAEKMGPLVSDDVIQSYPPHKETKVGRDDVISYITGKAGSTADAILKMDTMVRTVHKLVVEGDTAVGFHHMTAELQTGETYSNEYIWRYTCADGTVIRLDGMVDRLHVINQIGNHPALNLSNKQ